MTTDFIIRVHSMVDVITNSSTELFIIDETKIENGLGEVFSFLKGAGDFDYESEIIKFEDYEYSSEYKLIDETIDLANVYIIRADQNNQLLITLIEKFFNPLKFDYVYKY